MENLKVSEPVHEATVPTNEEVFQHMYRTTLNHITWQYAKTTYLVYTVNNLKEKILRSDGEGHAEKKLIEHLAKIPRNTPFQVNIYINNSPCYECAQLILDFLLKRRHISISIYAASLYNIKRRSCMTECYGNGKLGTDHKVRQEDSDQNSEGLRKLADHKRCEINVFDKDTWKDLVIILGIIKPDFHQQYGEKESFGNNFSRKEEDERLKSDLDYILIGDRVFTCQQDEYLAKIFKGMFDPALADYSCLVSTVSNEKLQHCTENKGLLDDSEKIKQRNVLICRLQDPSLEAKQKSDEEVMQSTFLKRLDEMFMSQPCKKMDVTIYMNSFPCPQFALNLIKFLGDKRQVTMCIYVANNKNVWDNGELIQRFNDHARCEVAAFDESVWKELIDVLGVYIPDFDQEYRLRSDADAKLKGILKKICDDEP